MKKYKVKINYHESKYFDVEAESQVAAERLAIIKAYADLPDNLYATVEKTEVEEMKTYDVTIQATVTKTIRVEAKDSNEATELAHCEFNVHSGEGEERYDEQTIEISEVTA